MKRMLRSLARRVRMHWPGRALSLRPLGDLELLSESEGIWRGTGGDPRFACVGAGFPLKAGWYELSIELQGSDGQRLEPVLYFDYGQGMHESWTLYLNFVRTDRLRHRGVVLLPADVRQLRLDPAQVPCTFRAGGLRLRRLGRATAAWRMWRSVHQGVRASGGDVRALRADAWVRLKGASGRRRFGEWLHGHYVRRGSRETTYDRWLQLYDPGIGGPLPAAGALVSILLPTYNTPETWLRRCLDSVLAQTWSNWELCVADDASTEPQVRAVLQEYAARDHRIRVVWRERNGHISATSNSALALARGEWVALLDHDDELHPAALAIMLEACSRHPEWQMAYSDEDKIDDEGRRYDPYFKPDWNYDLLLGQNCISHLGVYRRELLHAVGGFREGLEGSQDWDLALRCCERLAPGQVGHVPVVLYHWRAVEGSTARGISQKDYAHAAGRRALSEHLARLGERAEVLDIDGAPGMFRIHRLLPDALPRVSIVIPTRDQAALLRQCVESILQRSTYANYEIVLVDNQSSEPEALACLQELSTHPRVRVLEHDHPFNYSTINNEAVASCTGELVCLLNNDIEIITPGWLEELAGHALRPKVGAVGAMLYYPDDTIQHAGVVTGVHGVAAHPYCGMPRGYPGLMSRARLTQSMSAVTAACLMIRRGVYLEVGGLDESLQVAFNDVDFCLRLRERGYTNVWTPFAEMYHHESASRGQEDTSEKKRRFAGEVASMRERWGASLEADPAYSPNFTLTGAPFTLSFPPRKWSTAVVVPASSSEDPRDAVGQDVLCIGHSHLMCVAKAAREAGFHLQALNFWEMTDAVEQHEDGPRLSAPLQRKLREHAGPVFSLIGGGVYGELGTLVHPRRFDFVLPQAPELPLDDAAELLPALAVRRVMESMLADYLSLMAQVRALCSGPMFHIEPPPPSADGERMCKDVVWAMFPGMLREISPAALRLKLWKLHSRIIAEWCDEAGVRFVPCPPSSIGAEGFLDDACYGDGAHANVSYGERVIAQIRSLA
jgi:glycosyltransferase involved in cell wall biosynthesis